MSGCDIYFNKGIKGKHYKRPLDDSCATCDGDDRPKDPCVCPPLGEPNSKLGKKNLAYRRILGIIF